MVSISEFHVVRTRTAGVFYGKILTREDKLAGLSVTMGNARRLWYWDGASSLSQLAQEGVKRPQNCKFPCPVDHAELMEVVEILDLTPAAKANLDAVPFWAQ